MQGFTCDFAWDNLSLFPGNNLKPSLVILDCAFYPIIPSAPVSWDGVKWMVLVKEESDPQLIDALFNGANAFFSLKKEPKELCNLIIDTMENNAEADIVQFIRGYSKPDKVPKDAETYNLTSKEQNILELMTQGLHFKAIATQTGNTYETIRTHVKRIYKKLEVETASEAILKALKR